MHCAHAALSPATAIINGTMDDLRKGLLKRDMFDNMKPGPAVADLIYTEQTAAIFSIRVKHELRIL